jgi:hypothetical protein
MTLALLFSQTKDFHDGIKLPGDRIRKPLPKGYRYLHERPLEESEESKETIKKVIKPPKKVELMPVSEIQVKTLAEMFKGDLYPGYLYNLLDLVELGSEIPLIDLQLAKLEAELYQKIAKEQEQIGLLNDLNQWLFKQIQELRFSDDEILTILFLARKKH